MECKLRFSLSPGQGAGLADLPRSESLAKRHPSSRGGDGVAPVAPRADLRRVLHVLAVSSKSTEFRVEAPRNWEKDLNRAV